MEALVNKIIPFSSVDGPGNRTAIFLQGCNFSCLYCHNPETIQLCRACGICVDKYPTGALCLENGQVRYDSALCVYCDTCFKSCPHSASPRVRSMTPRQVMEEVSRNQPFIRGITVSGGECTRQRDFLVEFLTLAGQAGLDTLLDSNGSYDFSADPELMSVTGGVMLDVKAWDPAEHQRVTGQDNRQVLANLSWLAQAGRLEEVRTVVVPELFDAEQTVREVCRVVAPHIAKRNTRYKIICYRPFGVRQEYRGLIPPSGELLAHLCQLAQSCGVPNAVVV